MVTLFVCGDVMTGRGIDQILTHPGDPRLFEPQVQSALEYVRLAERVSGEIPRRTGAEYVWGDALEVWRRMRPQVRIINLETSVTTSQDADPAKRIHYRMHPDNVPCLTAAGVNCCVLANNHVLDWGPRGLEETLHSIHKARIQTAGAGRNCSEAAAPAVLAAPGARVLVYGVTFPSSGTPRTWRARRNHSGVNWFADLSGKTTDALRQRMDSDRQPDDLIVVSLHWGGNWGYEVQGFEREFAHRLIDTGVSLVHGHSSHHPRGIEVYRGKAILYGCGDLVNDYEGIGGYESFRPELSLMYFPVLETGGGALSAMTLVPMRMRRFRLQHASEEEAAWVLARMDRECGQWGVRVRARDNGTLHIEWRHDLPASSGRVVSACRSRGGI